MIAYNVSHFQAWFSSSFFLFRMSLAFVILLSCGKNTKKNVT